MAEKEMTAAEKREQNIRQKMLAGNMTRENAEMCMEHQEAEDAKRAKASKKKEEPTK
jgi:hypothetical protein